MFKTWFLSFFVIGLSSIVIADAIALDDIRTSGLKFLFVLTLCVALNDGEVVEIVQWSRWWSWWFFHVGVALEFSELDGAA